jgi:hypothetical protein
VEVDRTLEADPFACIALNQQSANVEAAHPRVLTRHYDG